MQYLESEILSGVNAPITVMGANGKPVEIPQSALRNAQLGMATSAGGGKGF